MILSITVKAITFWNWSLIYVVRNVSFTFDFKKLLESALRLVTDVILNILPCTADFTRVDGPMHDAGSVTRIAFKYKLTGFRINFFKIDFSVYYFVLDYS